MRNGGNIRKMNHPNGGFTLVEIVLSIAILAIVSLPLLRYFSESMRYSSMMEKRQQAAFLAQEVTEGLLAERVLISLDAESGEEDTSYTVSYFESEEWDDAEVEMDQKKSGELIITAQKNGYRVEVTIDNPHVSKDIKDIMDYRIDLPGNVIYIDAMENTRAVFEFMGMYNTFYDRQDTESMPSITEAGISENMSRKMRVGLSQTGEKYRVTLQYVYSCPVVRDKDGNTAVWISDVLMDQSVEDLQNIYLIYDWCKGGDTITFDTTGLNEATNTGMSLGLYIICRQSDGDQLPTVESKYTVTVDHSGFNGKLFAYTNLSKGQLVCENGEFSTPESFDPVTPGTVQTAVAYTIHTRVYLEEDLLADITTMKGE